MRQVPGPVHRHPGRREPGGGDPQQVAQLLVGQGQYIGRVLLGFEIVRQAEVLILKRMCVLMDKDYLFE